MVEDLSKSKVQLISESYIEHLVNMIDPLIIVSPAGTIQTVNAATCNLLGYEESELIGQPVGKIFAEELPLKTGVGIGDLTKKGFIQKVEITYLSKDGRKIPVFFSGSVVHDKHGKIQGIICMAQDITGHKRAEEALRRLEKAVEILQLGVTITDIEGRILYTNPTEASMHGYQVEELIGKDVGILAPPELRQPLTLEQIKEMKSWKREGVNIRKDGSIFPVQLISDVVKNATGQPISIVTICEDIVEREQAKEALKKAKEELELKVAERTLELNKLNEQLLIDIARRKLAEVGLRRREEHFRSLIENALDIITVVNGDGNIRYKSPSLSRILGYKSNELINRSILEFVHPDDAPRVLEAFAQGVPNPAGVAPLIEFRFRHKDGSWRVLEAVVNNLLDDSGVAGIVINSRDITERKRNEEVIRHLAYYDTLTGLPNRLLFSDRLNLALVHARRYEQMLAVMFLDLDHFKLINDTLGHTLGDQLLQDVARRLNSCLRKGDTIARLGGDEFALLLPQISDARNAVKIAHKILEAFKPSFQLDAYELHITASIGVALYPSDGEDAQTLLKNADTAMYRAKAQGRNSYQFSTATLNTKVFERLVMENGLRRALQREEFVLYYQPQVNLGTGRIVGMEALIRWLHPDWGLVSPTKFIPLAEDIGLVVPIGEWVLRTACAQSKAWQDTGLPPLRVSVNLSARQFQQPDLVETIAQVLKETRLEPCYLELEITESVAMQNAEFTLKMLHDLRGMGVLISLDDFGTDYSSLSYLKRFPIHKLKIDQSFIQDITTNPDSATIIAMIVTLAHNLRLNVLAEGVETQEQLDFLKQLQCGEAQGYLFSKPMSTEEFEKMLIQEKLLWHQ